jgi:hemerythrin
MSLFSWKPEYSVHEAELDSDHEKLFAILNSVYENVMSSRELNFVLPMIDELSAYTRSHFSAEERYMRKLGFTGIEDHIARHQDFTQKIEALRASYHDNDLEVARNLIIVLGEWLLQHVIKEDRKYAELSVSRE